MKITKLNITKLYGLYDYRDITFNSDVTFIHGLNGCGKTTILNIIETIITGKIYKLFNLDFEEIKLEYKKDRKNSEDKSIVINKKKNQLAIDFNSKKYVIKKNEESNYIRHDLSTSDSVDEQRYFFSKHPVLEKISSMFNYVYLPLDRSTTLYHNFDESYYYSKNIRKQKIAIAGNSNFYIGKEKSMWEVEDLIYRSSSQINSSISKINDEFRNQILKSSVDIGSSYSEDDLISLIINKHKSNINEIKKTKESYMSILSELSIMNDDEKVKIEKFFEGVISEVKENKEDAISLPLLFKRMEIIRVNKIVQLADANEQKKNEKKYPLELFVNTVNNFIETSEDGKKIIIDAEGRVYFKTKYSEELLSIQNLSSGEKQLVTFFSNLIFKVKLDSEGIFVVDEPELSLHLTWQKDFVNKIMEINDGIQLIFATHAPEMVGKNRNKLFKLEKKYLIDSVEVDDNE